jgi:hypothetical protein
VLTPSSVFPLPDCYVENTTGVVHSAGPLLNVRRNENEHWKESSGPTMQNYAGRGGHGRGVEVKRFRCRRNRRRLVRCGFRLGLQFGSFALP